jgi:hypothetical protein
MKRVRSRLLAALFIGLLVIVLVAACGDDDDDANGGPSLGVGPGISVTDALDNDASGPLLINGFLVIVEGEVELCEALAESIPPQCGGARLSIEGLDLSAFTLSQASGVQWTEDVVQVLGTVDGNRLIVSTTSK